MKLSSFSTFSMNLIPSLFFETILKLFKYNIIGILIISPLSFFSSNSFIFLFISFWSKQLFFPLK